MTEGMDDDLDDMDEQTRRKKEAGEKAADMITDEKIIGLGTGSTVKWTIRKLGTMVKEGLDIIGIPTSERSRKLAKKVGIPLTTLLDHPVIDLTIDGADEVDKKMNLISKNITKYPGTYPF